VGERGSAVGGLDERVTGTGPSALERAFEGRRVLITGHTGFKGSWLTQWLVTLGAEVSGYALAPPTEPNLFDALGLEARIHHIVGDVRQVEALSEAVRIAQPEVVIHLAASALVLGAYDAPRDTFETNVMGTVNTLEAARSSASVRAIVVVTTDKVYENPESGEAFTEDAPLGGRDPYAASKAAAEMVVGAYRASFPGALSNVATARAGNVIGGGDWAPDRIVPDAVRALLVGQPIAVRNPDAVRPWQHVLEPLSGYLWLAARLAVGGERFAGSWNFGPEMGAGRPVRWLVASLLESWGSGRWIVSDGAADRHEARLLQLDSTKSRERLGWAPVWDAPTAIGRTAAWYRSFTDDPASARALVGAEIAAFEADARAAGRPWAVSVDGE
jgi:CDP-glucose 4,6-dehydratase